MTPLYGRSVGIRRCGRSVLHDSELISKEIKVGEWSMRKIQLSGPKSSCQPGWWSSPVGGKGSNHHKKDFLILFRINVKISVRRLESFSYQ